MFSGMLEEMYSGYVVVVDVTVERVDFELWY